MEQALIQRAKQGDNQAFDAVIELHREAMFRYAYLILYDAEVADDVTQEAVLRIYRHLDQFDESYEFRPWALQITRNTARNHIRARGRYKKMVDSVIRVFERPATHVEAVTEEQLQATHLHEAVHQLEPDHQDVIYARFFLGLSVEECARTIGIAEGTVKSRSHRALKQLKALIQQDYPQLWETFHDG